MAHGTQKKHVSSAVSLLSRVPCTMCMHGRGMERRITECRMAHGTQKKHRSSAFSFLSHVPCTMCMHGRSMGMAHHRVQNGTWHVAHRNSMGVAHCRVAEWQMQPGTCMGLVSAHGT
eukprot:1143010-Pelagomonas_calceolata.AAC.1